MSNLLGTSTEGTASSNAREIELRAYRYMGGLLLVSVFDDNGEVAAMVISREDWNNKELLAIIIKRTLATGGLPVWIS